MDELHWVFERGLVLLPHHHDNVSLRLHFECRSEVVLTRWSTNRGISWICTHPVLTMIKPGDSSFLLRIIKRDNVVFVMTKGIWRIDSWLIEF